MINKDKLNTTNSLVAFVDLLGAKEIIIKDADESLNIIHDCYDYTCNKLIREYGSGFPKPNINIFSDNIILSLPCENVENEDHLYAFHSMLYFTSIILLYFWDNKFLVRGAISWGSFFADDLMVWGKGLVNAYKLESNTAIYPRVIIDPECVEGFEIACNSWEMKLMTCDFDGIYFVDPFYVQKKDVWLPILKNFEIDNIIRISEIDKNNAHIMQKLVWLQKYFEEKIDYLTSY